MVALATLTACGGGGGGGGGGSGGGGGIPTLPTIMLQQTINSLLTDPPQQSGTQQPTSIQIPQQQISTSGGGNTQVVFRSNNQIQIAGGNTQTFNTFQPATQNTPPFARTSNGNVILVNSDNALLDPNNPNNRRYRNARLLSLTVGNAAQQTVNAVSIIDASRGLTPLAPNRSPVMFNSAGSVANPFMPFADLPTQANIIYNGDIILQNTIPRTFQNTQGTQELVPNVNLDFARFNMQVDFATNQGEITGRALAVDENGVQHFGTLSGNRGGGNNANTFRLGLTIPSQNIVSNDINGRFYGEQALELAGVGNTMDNNNVIGIIGQRDNDNGGINPPPIIEVDETISSLFSDPADIRTTFVNGRTPIIEIPQQLISTAGSTTRASRDADGNVITDGSGNVVYENIGTLTQNISIDGNRIDITNIGRNRMGESRTDALGTRIIDQFLGSANQALGFARSNDDRISLVNTDVALVDPVGNYRRYEYARLLSLAVADEFNQTTETVSFIDASRFLTPVSDPSASPTNAALSQNGVVANPFMAQNLPANMNIVYNGDILLQNSKQTNAQTAPELNVRYGRFNLTLSLGNDGGNITGTALVEENNGTQHRGVFLGNTGQGTQRNTFTGTLTIPSEGINSNVSGRFYGNQANEFTAIGTANNNENAIALIGQRASGNLGPTVPTTLPPFPLTTLPQPTCQRPAGIPQGICPPEPTTTGPATTSQPAAPIAQLASIPVRGDSNLQDEEFVLVDGLSHYPNGAIDPPLRGPIALDRPTDGAHAGQTRVVIGSREYVFVPTLVPSPDPSRQNQGAGIVHPAELVQSIQSQDGSLKIVHHSVYNRVANDQSPPDPQSLHLSLETGQYAALRTIFTRRSLTTNTSLHFIEQIDLANVSDRNNATTQQQMNILYSLGEEVMYQGEYYLYTDFSDPLPAGVDRTTDPNLPDTFVAEPQRFASGLFEITIDFRRNPQFTRPVLATGITTSYNGTKQGDITINNPTFNDYTRTDNNQTISTNTFTGTYSHIGGGTNPDPSLQRTVPFKGQFYGTNAEEIAASGKTRNSDGNPTAIFGLLGGACPADCRPLP